MPRPKSLTLNDIAAAALTVIDREGLPTLSMRTVAQELGVGTMSLYRYVDDRGQLEELVVDLVFSAAAPPFPPRASWRKRLTLLLEGLRESFAAHIHAAPLLTPHRMTTHNALRWMETLLDVLNSAGFSGRARSRAFRALLGYAMGSIQAEHYAPLPVTEIPAEIADRADAFPHLTEYFEEAQHEKTADQFTAGLSALLEGLESRYLA
ncbi:TetR/AcrR family transcriptional regulator C-terminal domain-containing protein [Streptomyces sp. FZ201]|uniref:TetR/AcrR family transcriptional regulator n=1 Tax=Streptomyces sp. FZ201 TaxID=3057122 RepID=UPI0021C07659|nr:TetR/AcrR family transcriptional regulator C-terminal domain-containing protein [Streptomyces sp. FZ201]